MILPKQPNERANPASASLAYLRISKDIKCREKWFLSAYYVSGIVLGPWDFMVNRQSCPLS